MVSYTTVGGEKGTNGEKGELFRVPNPFQWDSSFLRDDGEPCGASLAHPTPGQYRRRENSGMDEAKIQNWETLKTYLSEKQL